MNLVRSTILLLLGASLLTIALLRLRTYRLKERYALAFCFLGIPFVTLAFWPHAIDYLASALGIAYQTVMLLGVSVFLFLAVFELLTIVSQQDRKITTLAQMVGILMEKQKHAESKTPDDQARDVTRASRP